MTPSDETNWIRPSDFSEVSFSVGLSNSVTNTHISSPGDAHTQLTSMSLDLITLNVPSTSCAMGHFLKIRILQIVSTPGKTNLESTIELTAKVVGEEPFNSDTKSVTLVVYQIDRKAWLKWLEEIDAWQKRITQVVQHVGGF
jgi:hypothetical protein